MKKNNCADCEKPVKKRLMRLLDALYEIKPAFPSSFWSKIREEIPKVKKGIYDVFLNNIPYLAIEFNHFVCSLDDEYFLRLGIAIDAIETKATKRFFTYRELRKKYSTDKEIFQKLYELEYPIEKRRNRPPFDKYNKQLWQWKNTSSVKKWLATDFILKPAQYIHFINRYEKPTLENDLRNQLLSINHPYINNIMSPSHPWNQYSDKTRAWDIIIYHFICFCLRRNKEIGERLKEYEGWLEYAGKIQFLLDPELAEEITCISEGWVKKRNKEDIIRDLVQISMRDEETSCWTAKKKRDTLRNRTKKYSKQYDELQRTAIEVITKTVRQKAEANNYPIKFFFSQKSPSSRWNLVKDHSISDWKQIVNFLKLYEEAFGLEAAIPESDQEEMLQKIFDVCREHRMFNPSEIEAKSYYLHLIRVRFFTILRKKLDPSKYIPNLKGVRFKEIDLQYTPYHPQKQKRKTQKKKKVLKRKKRI